MGWEQAQARSKEKFQDLVNFLCEREGGGLSGTDVVQDRLRTALRTQLLCHEPGNRHAWPLKQTTAWRNFCKNKFLPFYKIKVHSGNSKPS